MRLLFLSTAQSYRNNDFVVAADELAFEYVLLSDGNVGSTEPQVISLPFENVGVVLTRLRQLHIAQPFVAVLALDDSGAQLAAHIATVLAIPHNAFAAIMAARDKSLMRDALSRAGVLIPTYQRYTAATSIDTILAQTSFPCVIKPLLLNGSRGVIRANSVNEFLTARNTLISLLREIEGPAGEHAFLVESYIDGYEVAVEAILDNGELYPLAIFDKPDPLVGPLFEETIYVTPSRHPVEMQHAIIQTARNAAAAIGLVSGPVHAELRCNDAGVWVVEVAGRSIGGLCSRTLRFGVSDSLEILILRQAMGAFTTPEPPTRASGVMMIPIPHAGILQRVDGIDVARAMPFIESIEITSPLHQSIRTLPAGESYLGFIFARADTPEQVENALRSAHVALRILITPLVILT
ncbi:MAG: ATP-grasp domain-containing protein [Chloroflexi bacterium]|nr:MAG: ATP-grasp domain-containing protein [Chloroflexota bacterium]RLT34075.1 MAG: ATP-grasp domain-containing protein [Chloroflexota bacterium]